MARALVGIAGWTYAPWRGDFYPKGLPQREELSYAAERLDSIEINGTFYGLQRPSSYRRWAELTPDGFVFAVKGSRFITHIKRLRDVHQPLADFFASGMLALGPKLGPFLWQLPPTLRFDAAAVEAFFGLLPGSTVAASHLAAHSTLEEDRRETHFGPNTPLRHAMEVRNETFDDPRFVELARKAGVAIVVADTAGRYPVLRERTTDFMYVRLHGDKELYTSGYDAEALDRWARDIRAWLRDGLDVYAYFDNDVKVRSPYDAMGLRGRLRGVAK